MTNAVLFDLDGCLVNSEPVRQKCWLTVLNSYTNISLDQLAIYSGLLDSIMLDDLRCRNIIPSYVQNKNLIKDFSSIYHGFTNIPEIPGATVFLDFLKSNGTQIALCTSSYKNSYDRIIKDKGWSGYFQFITGIEDGIRPKPKPDIYLATLKKLEIPSCECVVFEDSKAGINAAVDANLKVIGVESTLSRNDLLRYGAFDSITDYTNQNILKELLSITKGEIHED